MIINTKLLSKKDMLEIKKLLLRINAPFVSEETGFEDYKNSLREELANILDEELKLNILKFKLLLASFTKAPTTDINNLEISFKTKKDADISDFSDIAESIKVNSSNKELKERAPEIFSLFANSYELKSINKDQLENFQNLYESCNIETIKNSTNG